MVLENTLPTSAKTLQKHRQTILIIINYCTKTKKHFLHPTNKTELDKLIDKLPNKRSSGFDDVSNVMFKKVKGSLLDPLTKLFNLTLSQGIFPDLMKQA